MDDRKWGDLSEGEFDALLGAGLQDLPPEEVVEEVTPWKRAMNRVLAGMALSTVTLNFWLLDTILPAIGVVLMLLGFRSLRFENRWFGSCFVLTLLRAVHFFLLLILNTTIWVSAGVCVLLAGAAGGAGKGGAPTAGQGRGMADILVSPDVCLGYGGV